MNLLWHQPRNQTQIWSVAWFKLFPLFVNERMLFGWGGKGSLCSNPYLSYGVWWAQPVWTRCSRERRDSAPLMAQWTLKATDPYLGKSEDHLPELLECVKKRIIIMQALRPHLESTEWEFLGTELRIHTKSQLTLRRSNFLESLLWGLEKLQQEALNLEQYDSTLPFTALFSNNKESIRCIAGELVTVSQALLYWWCGMNPRVRPTFDCSLGEERAGEILGQGRRIRN